MQNGHAKWPDKEQVFTLITFSVHIQFLACHLSAFFSSLFQRSLHLALKFFWVDVVFCLVNVIKVFNFRSFCILLVALVSWLYTVLIFQVSMAT